MDQESAENWVTKNSGRIDELIDEGADVALQTYVAGIKSYIKDTANSAKLGVAAVKALSSGNWKEAGKLAIQAGVGLDGASTKAFKTAFSVGIKKSLRAAGQAKAAVLFNQIEKKMEAKKAAFQKQATKEVTKRLK